MTERDHPPSDERRSSPDRIMFDEVLDGYQGVTWDERVVRAGILGSALDPADRTGRKNLYIDRLQRRALRKILDDLVASRGSMFDRALDFGCGGGRLTSELRRYARDVYGV